MPGAFQLLSASSDGVSPRACFSLMSRSQSGTTTPKLPDDPLPAALSMSNGDPVPPRRCSHPHPHAEPLGQPRASRPGGGCGAPAATPPGTNAALSLPCPAHTAHCARITRRVAGSMARRVRALMKKNVSEFVCVRALQGPSSKMFKSFASSTMSPFSLTNLQVSIGGRNVLNSTLNMTYENF